MSLVMESLFDSAAEDEPLLSQKTRAHPTKSEYTAFIAFCFAINYNIGAGVLALPYEFAKAGVILAPILLGCCVCLAYVTFQWILETMVRAEAITTVARRVAIDEDIIQRSPDDLIRRLHIANVSQDDLEREMNILPQLERNEYELNSLVYMFMGHKIGLFYDALYSLATWCVLWSYATLVPTSATRFAGIIGLHRACDITTSKSRGCVAVYTGYAILFWIWAVFISCRDFKEQAGLQVTMTMLRVIVIGLMCITSAVLLFSPLVYSQVTGKYQSGASRTPIPGASTSNPANLANMWYIPAFLVVGWFAVSSQASIPDVIHPMRNKRKALRVFAVMLLTCFTLYAVLGITTSLYFGLTLEAPCTLAWEYFRGFQAKPSETEFLIGHAISSLIVLFPIADISSAFPLNAITLSNNIIHSLFPSVMAEDRRYHLALRIFVCTTAVIAAICYTNLELILSITGMFQLITTGIVPYLLQRYSQRMCCKIAGHNRVTEARDLVSSYLTPFSWSCCCIDLWNVTVLGPVVFIFALGCIITVVCQLIFRFV